MRKKEFLKILSDNLQNIDAEDREDILKEYNDYIEDKIKKGLTEEEAVNVFGSPKELAEELYKTYKPKDDIENNSLDEFVNHLVLSIDKMANYLGQKSLKELIQFILEVLLILFLLFLCHIPFSLLIGLGKDIFYILSSPLNRLFYYLWKFVLEIAYLLGSFYIFKNVLQERYFNDKSSSFTNSKNVTLISHTGEVVIKVFGYFLKFMAVFLLFVLSTFLIVMTFVLSLCVYLLIKKVYYFGLYLVLFSLFLFGLIFFMVLYHFITNKKGKSKRYLYTFMTTIFLLGFGCFLVFDEITQTEFISGVPSDIKLETLTEELIMNKDTVFLGNIASYHVDNELETIKVTYEYYPLGNEMKTNITKKDNLVYLNYTLEKINIKTDILNHMIRDLREKKVYDYKLEPTITITASEKNIEMIKKNRQKYYQTKQNYTSCEFVRTYKILNSVSSSDDLSLYLTLQSFLSDDVQTVKVKKELLNDVTIGASYEFTFKTYQAYIDTSIENLFLENEVVKITKTDKEGMNQIEEDSCSNFY